jgi:hypothetical protein
MENWIALRPRFIFARKLAYLTNVTSLKDLVFIYKNGNMVVKVAEKLLVTTDGRDTLRIGDQQFKNRFVKKSVERLESNSFSVGYGPVLAGMERSNNRELSCSRSEEESYVVLRHYGWVTHCEIKSTGKRADPLLMVGCLAYFWVEAEKERRWT